MTRADIVRELEALPFEEQFKMLEFLARLLRQASQTHSLTRTAGPNLKTAAEALRADYQTDNELTAFTALDVEDFHAAR